MKQEAAAPSSIESPLRHTEFRKLFSAQVIALVGTGLTTVALTLLAYNMAGENAGIVLGTALSFKMVAYVVFAPIVGGMAHRFPRKPLLISLDVVRAVIVLLMPFVTAVWQIYLLIFLLNLFSAGFKPVFAATIPDILPDERQYTQALSYSRLAYDLENLLSPAFAGIALLFFTFSGLFAANAVAFMISAGLILVTVLPKHEVQDRLGGVWGEISFGVRSYMRTPRLRALLTLYCAVACASAMVIVNTVVYVKETLGGSDTEVAAAFAAAGFGSMIAAMSMTRILDRVSDRLVMLVGAVGMGIGVLGIWTGPDLTTMLPVWMLIGLGWSLVQTPAGRIVNRSSSAGDRSAYFSAQFALSHACWLVAYPVAGQLGAAFGIEQTAAYMGAAIIIFAGLAAAVWPRGDETELEHIHETVKHGHLHTHGSHHQHEHGGEEELEPHSHPHHHKEIKHAHEFYIDDHHLYWPKV
ncbi:MAG: MFS transporter [Chromatiales bacterium]|jgi:MFS family permease|nr:MFS transporter [Chromatiales bacterium]MDP6150275.1 MFS transporter [Gammaproteobacteria bacterium]MDP7093843.1 MFS transporter [Gammaproteobacteria bacterium]MDP7270782.1 MFS transporter [Gammaproteobacteria bacterium]HJP05030.1 MFS transporter [Gammaproteobacteria bacterium]